MWCLRARVKNPARWRGDKACYMWWVLNQGLIQRTLLVSVTGRLEMGSQVGRYCSDRAGEGSGPLNLVDFVVGNHGLGSNSET